MDEVESMTMHVAVVTDVAGVEPAVAEDFGGCLGLVEITVCDDRTTDQDFANVTFGRIAVNANIVMV